MSQEQDDLGLACDKFLEDMIKSSYHGLKLN
jgi:hypothetical protein